MSIRHAAVAAALAAAALAAPASATEVCQSKSFGEKFNGLWVMACVGDERESPVYVTCGTYTADCAR